MQDINLSSSISYIGEGAFGCCSSLSEINIDTSNTYYSSYNGVLYNKAETKLLHVPNLSSGYILYSTSTIGPYAFCGNLQGGGFDFTTFDITTIEKGAFAYCSYKTEVILGSNVSNIGEDAFYNCYNLSYITVPQKVKTINKNTFAFCSKLQSVYFAGNIEKIDNSAFESCSSLNNISFPTSLKYIGDYSFMYSGISSIYIPASVTHIGKYAFNACVNLKDIEVNSSNGYFCSLNAALFNKSKTSLLQYAIANNSSSYVIPDGVEMIAKGAFESSANLTQITIPESVETIESWAFSSCYELNDVYYLGYNSQWEDVFIAEYNDSLFEAEMHFDKIAITGISLNKTAISIFVGDTEILIANITPYNATNKAIIWTSSNNSVVTVSGGKITAIASGIATITAKTVNGGYFASCVVTVIIPKVEITLFTAADYGANAFINLSVVNPPADAVVYVASYDTLGKLLELQNLTLNNGSASAIFSTSRVYKYKAFIWKGDTIRPLSDPKECKLQ